MIILKIALNYLLNIVEIVILIRCILSWIPDLNNRFVYIIYSITDPILQPVQKLISKIMGGRPIYIDLSPIVVFLIIQYLVRPIIYML